MGALFFSVQLSFLDIYTEYWPGLLHALPRSTHSLTHSLTHSSQGTLTRAATMPLRVATAVLLAAAAAGAQPTTTTLTSGAHPASACHGNGLVQPDTEPLFADQHPVSAAPATRCECFPCYTGADCSEYAETSAANCAPLDASVGTAVMAEYWENQWNDSTLATPVPPFYRCEYQDPTVMPAFLEGQNANTLEAINRLHEATGNAVSRNKNVILGDGATEVCAQLCLLWTAFFLFFVFSG